MAELGQQIGRVAHRGGVPGVHRSLDRGLEGEADAQATRFPLCRGREGLRRGRRPCGIPQLVAGEHVEHGRGLADRPGQAARHRRQMLADVGPQRDPAARGLEPHQSAARRGNAGGASAVGGVRYRHHARGDGGAGAAGGPARGA